MLKAGRLFSVLVYFLCITQEIHRVFQRGLKPPSACDSCSARIVSFITRVSSSSMAQTRISDQIKRLINCARAIVWLSVNSVFTVTVVIV